MAVAPCAVFRRLQIQVRAAEFWGPVVSVAVMRRRMTGVSFAVLDLVLSAGENGLRSQTLEGDGVRPPDSCVRQSSSPRLRAPRGLVRLRGRADWSERSRSRVIGVALEPRSILSRRVLGLYLRAIASLRFAGNRKRRRGDGRLSPRTGSVRHAIT